LNEPSASIDEEAWFDSNEQPSSGELDGIRRAVASLEDGTISLPERVERFESEVIRATLASTQGDVKETITRLGIPRKTFYDKLQRHGIARGDFVK
jgi:two-component system C4-dicarboxylate transport response regulator DctD